MQLHSVQQGWSTKYTWKPFQKHPTTSLTQNAQEFRLLSTSQKLQINLCCALNCRRQRQGDRHPWPVQLRMIQSLFFFPFALGHPSLYLTLFLHTSLISTKCWQLCCSVNPQICALQNHSARNQATTSWLWRKPRRQWWWWTISQRWFLTVTEWVYFTCAN